jgi:hypothetical protein
MKESSKSTRMFATVMTVIEFQFKHLSISKLMENLSPVRNLLYMTSYNKIDNPVIRDFVKNALDHAPQEFWKAQSSGSGKYHPPEDQGVGGLIRHLVKCVYTSEELGNFFNISYTDRDIVLAGTLLHDIQKNGIPWGEMTHYEHGKIASDWLDNFTLDNKIKDGIRNCVRYHMYRWCEPEKEKMRAINPTINEKIVQLSDFFSSRKCASFLPGYEIPEEIIENYF